jgi:methanol--5-hydroxybenzimidazolylcobamide Co-methyltransferase
MSLEGKSSACAHASLIGNIPMSVADLWSNESIEYTKLYGGMGPEVSLEMLYYDTSLLNTSIQEKKEFLLQDLIIKSNALKDPQALILTPENSIRIAKAIIEKSTYYERSLNAALEAVKIIDENQDNLALPQIEIRYIKRIRTDLENLPDEESVFIDTLVRKYTQMSKDFLPRNYEI